MIITNLFSIFDPSLGVFSFSWVLLVLVLFFFPVFFWVSRKFTVFFSLLIGFFLKEVDYALGRVISGIYGFICTLFFIILFYNFLALFPHVFSLTSHILITLPFSFVFWTSVIFFSWVSSLNHFLSHLIPVGTPFALMSFIVIVEVLSNFIRPLALTFRLTANMIAGHLLMSLVGSALVSMPVYLLFFGSILQSLLVFMEIGVSCIQAYVFYVLILLYLSEAKH